MKERLEGKLDDSDEARARTLAAMALDCVMENAASMELREKYGAAFEREDGAIVEFSLKCRPKTKEERDREG